jgi:hypothetical protein
VKIPLPLDLISSIEVDPSYLEWGDGVINPVRIITRREHTNTHSTTFTFYGKTYLQLMMETEVTLTFQRKTVSVWQRTQFQGKYLGGHDIDHKHPNVYCQLIF